MQGRVRIARQLSWGLVLSLCISPAVLDSARADSLPIRNLSLEIQILDLDPLVIPTTVGAGGSSIEGTRTPSSITNLELPAALFAGTDIEVPVVGVPLLGTIGVFDVVSGPGSFAIVGSELEGTLALDGELEACLEFGTPGECLEFPPPGPFLTWNLGVVGSGGSSTANQGANSLTLVGAPWTTGEAAVGTESRLGSISPLGDGFLAVELVTPIRFDTDLPAPNDTIPAFGLLTFEVPEPGSSALGLFALGTVFWLRAFRPR